MRRLIFALIAVMVATAAPEAFAQSKQVRKPSQAKVTPARKSGSSARKLTATPEWLKGIWVKPAEDGDYELHISDKEVEMYFNDADGSGLLYSGTFTIKGNKLVSDDNRFTLTINPKEYTFTDSNSDPSVPWEPMCDDYVEDDGASATQNTTIDIVRDQDADADPTRSVIHKAVEQPRQNDDKIYQINELEVKPEFPGGERAMYSWLANNMEYPKSAAQARIQGRVVVAFVIDRDGSVKDVRTAVSVHPALDEEAMRVIRKMPAWKPGSSNGKPVKVHYMLPLTFKLSQK